MVRAIPAVVALGLVALLTGCASNTPAEAERYTLVYLKTGPKSATNTPEEKKQIFAGHMSNMQRHADEGKLIIAGPFAKPTDPAWRGIFVFDVADTDEATRLAVTDPGVVGGEFVVVVRPVRGSPALRTVPALDKAAKEQAGMAPTEPGKPPANIRAFVMITAQDYQRAARAIDARPAVRTLWRAAFADGPGGVLVIDALAPDAARAALEGADTGPVVVDGWYSTTGLLGLAKR